FRHESYFIQGNSGIADDIFVASGIIGDSKLYPPKTCKDAPPVPIIMPISYRGQILDLVE
ncbi:hypothetical protein HDU76_008104, partial [Blyttiomyces sp. JEL0837]